MDTLIAYQIYIPTRAAYTPRQNALCPFPNTILEFAVYLFTAFNPPLGVADFVTRIELFVKMLDLHAP